MQKLHVYQSGKKMQKQKGFKKLPKKKAMLNIPMYVTNRKVKSPSLN